MTTDKAFAASAATVQRVHAAYWLQTRGDPECVATVMPE